MPKLYFLCTNGVTHLALNQLLQQQSHILEKQNIFFDFEHPFINKLNTDYKSFSVQIYLEWMKIRNEESTKNSIHITQLEKILSSGQDIIFPINTIGQGFIDFIFEHLKRYDGFKNYEPHALLMLSRQDNTMLNMQLLFWQNFDSRKFIQISQAGIPDWYKYDDIYKSFEKICGKNNCTVLLDDAATPFIQDNNYLKNFLEYFNLNIHDAELENSLKVPMTAPSLNFIEVIKSFKNIYKDTIEILQELFKIEAKYNFEKALYYPAYIQKNILDLSAEHNNNLAKILQKDKLFDENHVLDNINCINKAPATMDKADYIKIISSLPLHIYNKLLCYFENEKYILSPEQKIVAELLEDHIKKHPKSIKSHPPKRNQPLVSVLTLSFNQENFITECLESVGKQECDFAIEHIVVDNVSTDNTPNIIYKYAQRHNHVRPILLQQHGKHIEYLFNSCKSKYVVICDGDDYFTDKHKLQKQVELLEANPDYGLCFHPVSVVYEDGKTQSRIHPPKEMLPGRVKNYYELIDLLKVNFIQTNSAMYRWRFADGLPSWFNSSLIPGDWYWHLLHAELGKIGFINEIMSVYRRHTASLYYGTELPNNTINHRLKFGERELEVYNTLNEHFNGKYEKEISNLSNGVFSNFLQHYMDTQDRTFLDIATQKYPQLGKLFLQKLNTQKT